MAFPVAAAIAGGASIFGSIFGNRRSRGPSAESLQRERDLESRSSAREIEAARVANEHTDRRIDDGRAWQEEMRASAYQTSVEDMRKAGINPAVAMAGHGGVASAPGGPMAGAVKADVSGASNAASSRMAARTGEKRARTDTGRLMKDVALAGAGIASKWLEGKKQKKQVDHIAAETASAKATKAHTDAVTAGVNARNVPDIQAAQFYKDNPKMGYYGPLLKPANSAMKAAMGVLGLRGAGRAFGSGLKKSWGKRPPRKGKGKSWSAKENREWSRNFGFDGKPRKKGY